MVSLTEKIREMNANDRMYYLKIFFAIIASILCVLFDLRGWRGGLFGLVIYGFTYYITIYVMGIDPSEVGGKTKVITSGLFSYLLIWVLTWTILFDFIVLS